MAKNNQFFSLAVVAVDEQAVSLSHLSRQHLRRKELPANVQVQNRKKLMYDSIAITVTYH